MEYEVNLSDDIDFAPKTKVHEILQNVRTILNTVLGSVPLERSIGVSWEYIGKPIQVAMNELKIAVYDAIQSQEPRAQISELSFNVSDNKSDFVEQGILVPRLKVYISE